MQGSKAKQKKTGIIRKLQNFLCVPSLIFVEIKFLAVGIATRYGLDGPGIESRRKRGNHHLTRPALGPSKPPV